MTAAAEVAGEGPTVMLIHGQPGSASDWAAVVPLLAERYRVVSFDRPGYGRNAAPAGDFAANAHALVEVMDQMAAKQAILVGHSWGGGVALHVAAHFPQRVAGLVLVASVSPLSPSSAADRLLARQPLGDVMTAAAFVVGGRVLSLPPVGWLMARRLPLAAQRALGGWSTAGDHRRMARSFTIEQRAFVDQLPGLAGTLRGIAVPTTVVTGDSDHVVAPTVSGRLAAAISGAELVRVAGAGHLLPLDRPEAVASAVDDVAARGGLRERRRPAKSDSGPS
ncbi:MAG: alpha/beta hydrolase [Actinomycetota bacterium]|nr:alpha/beta hydrolase [Actinomycetota bacterium]